MSMELVGKAPTPKTAEELREAAKGDFDKVLIGLGRAHRYVAYTARELSEAEKRCRAAEKPAFRKKDEGGILLSTRRDVLRSQEQKHKEALAALEDSENRARAFFAAAQEGQAQLEPVNYDVRTGDVLVLPDSPESGALLVTETGPDRVRMTNGNDTLTLDYQCLTERKAVYLFKRPTVAGPRSASFAGGHI